MATTLADEFLTWLVSEFAGERAIAAALSGSYARGEAGPFSDVDLLCFTRGSTAGAAGAREEVLVYRDQILVSVTYADLETWRAFLTRPRTAIRAVPAFRNLRILLDREGALAALKQEAVDFAWASLQPEADRQAGAIVLHLGEVVHKLLGGLHARDERRLVGPTWELVQELTEAVAVQRGAFIAAENDVFSVAQRAAGRDSAWARQHARALGLAGGSSSPARRAEAALALYRETAALLGPILPPGHGATVAGVLARIERPFDLTATQPPLAPPG